MSWLTNLYSISGDHSSDINYKSNRSGEDLENRSTSIHILFGTTTGNSEMLADEAAEKLKEIGSSIVVSGMEDFNPDELYRIETLLVITSTDNEGDPPFMAEGFYKFLDGKTEADLDHLSYSVLALGDSYYPDFCQAGKDFDRMLERLGGRRIVERVDCDIDFWKSYDSWIEKVLVAIKEKGKQPVSVRRT